MVMRVPARRKRSRARMRPGVLERRRAIGQPLPSQRSSTVVPDGAATFSRVTREPRAATYPRMRTTGNGRRYRGAAGPARTGPQSGAALLRPTPAEPKVGAGAVASDVEVGSGTVASGGGVG